ncbi:MAG: hypothetical protein ACLQM8_11400 [Limisphaerales bacterium]
MSFLARREGKATAYIWCIYLGSGGDGLNLQSEELKLTISARAAASRITPDAPSQTGFFLLTCLIMRSEFFSQ